MRAFVWVLLGLMRRYTWEFGFDRSSFAACLHVASDIEGCLEAKNEKEEARGRLLAWAQAMGAMY